MDKPEIEARVSELNLLLMDLRQRGSYSLLGFGAEGYLGRVIRKRIEELQNGT